MRKSTRRRSATLSVTLRRDLLARSEIVFAHLDGSFLSGGRAAMRAWYRKRGEASTAVWREGVGMWRGQVVSLPVARVAWTVLLAVLVAGCAVVPLPMSRAERDQGPREQNWDVKDCQAEAGYRTGYSPESSPLLNWLQRLFFWSATGAATGFGVMTIAGSAGATVTGPTFISSPLGEAMVAGAGAGAITGTILGWSGQTRFERAWIACMEARGYSIARAGGQEQARRTVPP